MIKTVKNWIIEAKKKNKNLPRFSFETLAKEIDLNADEINREALEYVVKGYLIEIYEVRCPKCEKPINKYTSYPKIPLDHVCLSCGEKVQLKGNVYSHYILSNNRKGK